MTEDEAKKKWCPMVRVVEASKAGASSPRNRAARLEGSNAEILSNNLVGCQCIASDCMMWQWKLNDKGQPTHNNNSLTDKDRLGYCGLVNHRG